MNKEEILAMEAGDELNTAVAELIGDDLDHHWAGGAPKSGVKYCTRCSTPDWAPAAKRPCNVKLYSEDISTAWLVVEKMRASDMYNFGRIKKEPKDKRQYDPTFVDFCSRLMEVLEIGISEYSYPATLTIMWKIDPEVICKAVLLTKVEDD